MPYLETNVYNSFIHTCTVIHRANLKNISVSPYLTLFPWYGSVGKIFLSSLLNPLNLIVNTYRSSPLGAWDGLRYFIVALPEPSI